MTTLAITGDLHVDDLLPKIDPATGWSASFEDGIAAIRFVGRTAVERSAEALVVAGDYTERRSPAPPRVARILGALHDGPGRQVHVRGNHDQERSGHSIVDVLGAVDGWTGLTKPGVELVGDVAICAIPFLSPTYLRAQDGYETADIASVNRALAEAYLTIARGLYVSAQSLGASTTILVGHQQLAGGRMNDSQAAFLGDRDLVVDSRALAAIGFGAVVFAHVHRAQTVIDDPACPVVFTGSTHRVDWAEEHEDKSFVLLKAEAGRVSIERIPIPARRFVTLDFAADPTAGDDWPDRVPGAIVRVLNVLPSDDVTEIRRQLEAAGAFEVSEIRRRPVEAPESNGGLSETLTAPEALEAYFADDPDREILVERGRALLTEVAA